MAQDHEDPRWVVIVGDADHSFVAYGAYRWLARAERLATRIKRHRKCYGCKDGVSLPVAVVSMDHWDKLRARPRLAGGASLA